MPGVYRTIGWQSQEALNDTLRALQDARGRVSSAQETRITELMGALEHGNAPAGLPRSEDDNTADMCVTVTWPMGKGIMQTATFDRDGGPDPATMLTVDRVIVRALLEHALECLG